MILNNKSNEEKDIYKIQRGTSLAIPIYLKDDVGEFINLEGSGAYLYFTLKKDEYDHDYDDVRALIQHDAVFCGDHYEVRLTSKDTWQEPGDYYFDIMLRAENDIVRLCLVKAKIEGGPSNRYQSDLTDGLVLDKTICIGLYEPRPINVTFMDKIVLRADDLPLIAEPSYLLDEKNFLNRKVKTIKHFTSRFRDCVDIKVEGNESKIFIFDDISKFNFREKNPMGEIRFEIVDEKFAIWSVPRNAVITYYTSEAFPREDAEYHVGETLIIPQNATFEARITFDNHQLVISGRHCKNHWPLTVEWFDYNI